MDLPEISIIVAAFNEEESIVECVSAIAEVFPSSAEILVVNGGHDATGERVRAAGERIPFLRYIRNENDRGKGHAIRTGIAHARGKFQAQIDADLQFFPADLPRLFQPLREGKADVVLGTRFRDKGRRDEEAGFFRSAGNRVISAYMSLLFGHRMTDVLAGMKAWTREAAAAIDLKTDGFSYELEIPARAIRRGLRVAEVSVGTQARRGGASKVNVPGEGVRFFRDATRFRFSRK